MRHRAANGAAHRPAALPWGRITPDEPEVGSSALLEGAAALLSLAVVISAAAVACVVDAELTAAVGKVVERAAAMMVAVAMAEGEMAVAMAVGRHAPRSLSTHAARPGKHARTDDWV